MGWNVIQYNYNPLTSTGELQLVSLLILIVFKATFVNKALNFQGDEPIHPLFYWSYPAILNVKPVQLFFFFPNLNIAI